MESNIRGQFYMVGGLMIILYLLFISNVLISISTHPKLPTLASPENLLDVMQEIADEGGNTEESIKNLFETMKFSEQHFYVECTSNATNENKCTLSEAHWRCGVTVTASIGSREYARITRLIQSRSEFIANVSRIPVFIEANETANLVKMSVSLSGINTPPLAYDNGRIIKVSCSGSTCSFRTNVIKEEPKVIYFYNSTSINYALFDDFAVLNDDGYDGSKIANMLENAGVDYENITLAQIPSIEGHAGPIVLFLPSSYPAKYGSNLLNYVEEGGIIVSPYGLCSNTTLECLAGSIEKIEDSHSLANYSFTVDVSSTNSEYFTEADIPWAVYNSTQINASRAAIGAIKYGEGWIVFVGNESMLKTWDNAQDFIDFIVSWAKPALSLTIKTCPLQKV